MEIEELLKFTEKKKGLFLEQFFVPLDFTFSNRGKENGRFLYSPFSIFQILAFPDRQE